VVLRALLNSPAFWDQRNRLTLVKSPAELVVGTLRALELQQGREAARANREIGLMGQSLFAPPNVKGWPGGAAWIDSASLLARREFLSVLTRPRHAEHLAQWQGTLSRDGLDASALLLGDSAASASSNLTDLLADARYQLK
jgi:uncharacterized protein (DUF1800 family)